MADDDYANAPSESSMGNYHSRDWGFLKFSDCWRENRGSLACVSTRAWRCVFVSFGKLAGFEIEAVAAPAKQGFAAFEFMLCRFICTGSRSVTWPMVKSVPTVPQRSSEISFISRIWPAVLVTGPARHLSARCACVFFFFFFFSYVTHVQP